MAIPVNFPYDGNDANDGISLLEQGSVISVMSVITIKGVLICRCAAELVICSFGRFFGYCEYIVAVA